MDERGFGVQVEGWPTSHAMNRAEVEWWITLANKAGLAWRVELVEQPHEQAWREIQDAWEGVEKERVPVGR